MIKEENKEQNINTMIQNLLGMKIVQEDNSVIFTDEAKKLIQKIADACMQSEIFIDNKDLRENYEKGISAEDVYIDMLHKIVHAPSYLHMEMSAKMLIPIIHLKIQNGEYGNQHKQEPVQEELDGSPFRWGGLGRNFEKTAGEWQLENPSEENYRSCHLCHKEFDPEEHLYCGVFKQATGGRKFRIICRSCAYKFGNVIEP